MNRIDEVRMYLKNANDELWKNKCCVGCDDSCPFYKGEYVDCVCDHVERALQCIDRIIELMEV